METQKALIALQECLVGSEYMLDWRKNIDELSDQLWDHESEALKYEESGGGRHVVDVDGKSGTMWKVEPSQDTQQQHTFQLAFRSRAWGL